MKNRIMTARSGLLLAATTAGLLTMAAANATTPAPVSDQQQSADAVATSGQGNSVRVYIDPKTGKTRQATAEERVQAAKQDAIAAKSHKSQTIKFVRQPNGMRRAVDKDGLLLESVVVHKNADGTLSYQYVDGDGAEQANAAPVSQLEEK
jgi:hypothetical protein